MKKTDGHLSHLIYIALGCFLAVVFEKASASAYNAEGAIKGINFNLFNAGASICFVI